MTRKDAIAAKLTALSPSMLEVLDESHQHVGHAGAPEEGESHFRVRISSAELTGPKVAQHRAIYGAIGPDLMAQIHALAIEIT
ncbi:MAG: BolA family protein [Pseudomonadota bacterium]